MSVDSVDEYHAAQLSAVGEHGLATAWVTDEREFAGLAQQWEHLVGECSSSTPFQTHAWLNAWWRAYGKPGRLRVVMVYAGDRIVAAAPLHLKSLVPVRVLGPLGEGISDFSDILIIDDLGDARGHVLRVLVEALDEAKDWDAIDLPEVPPGAAAHGLAEVWPGRLSRTDAALCIEFPAQDIDALVGQLSGTTRRKRRQALRRIERAGVTSRVVPGEEVPDVLQHFHRLHEAQWEGRGINPEHVRPRFRRFLSEAIPTMVGRGQAVVTQSHLGDELMAVLIYVSNPSMLGGYLAGVSPELRKHVDVSTQQLHDDMVLAQRLGVARVSLLRGAEETKLRWLSAALSPRNTRIVLGRSGRVSAVIWTAVADRRAHAKAWLIKHASWSRQVPHRLHQLRNRARTWVK